MVYERRSIFHSPSSILYSLFSIIILLSLAAAQVHAQPADSSQFRPNRFWPGVGALAAGDVVVVYGLNNLWYSGHDRTPFHWYGGSNWADDWNTYAQQDKLGHAFVSWHLARVLGEFALWSGLSRKKAGVFGGAASALFQSQIEFFDGFSAAFGASRTDILANLIGGAAGGAKVAFPEELSWITSKYSYHPSPYYDEDASSLAPFRYLGNVLKDYDGISYWLVFRPSEVDLPMTWPEWLGVSVGYSATGLAHPLSGLTETGDLGGPEHRRQIFLSPDIDLLSARSSWPQPFRTIAGLLSFVRLPSPALQLTPEIRWYWIYY